MSPLEAPPPLGLVQRVVSWLVVPTVLLMEFVDLRQGVHRRPELVSAYLVGFTLLTLVCLPFALRHRRDLTRSGALMLGGFLGLVGYALLRTLTEPLPVMQKGVVPRAYLVVPVVTALVCATSAWTTLLAIPRHLRLHRLWWAGVAILAASLVNWPRQVLATRSFRMATGMGGSSTYHVVLLLCLTLFLGCFAQGIRRRWSAALALTSLVFTVLTGSRAALVGLATLLVLLVVAAVARGSRRLVLPILGTAVLLGVLLVALPSTRRMLLFSDATRQTNLRTAMAVFREHPLLGLGSGRLWPWYAFEAGLMPRPGGGLVRTAYGLALVNPHSLVLGVLVELGVVGLLVLLTVLVPPVVELVRSLLASRRGVGRGAPLRGVLAAGVVAALVANLFDTYLLKNFGVSWWWWVVAALAVGTSFATHPGTDPPTSPAAEHGR